MSHDAEATRIYNAVPDALPGFEHIKRYWDGQNSIFAAKIIQGEYYVTAHGEMISTVLGSCVAACIRDPQTGVGGMNHFMLPDSNGRGDRWAGSPVDTALRYGNVAMERLINSVLALGARRRSLEIKLFGGGRLLDISADIGRYNIEFVRKYLQMEGLRISSEDLGGEHPRKILYFPTSGRVLVKKLLRLHNATLNERERLYMEELKKGPVRGEVDLFN
jgi:chemotaxis protein CheD